MRSISWIICVLHVCTYGFIVLQARRFGDAGSDLMSQGAGRDLGPQAGIFYV